MAIIRQLAASRSGSVVVAAEFENLVHLFDLRTLDCIRTIQTTLDFGGRRLAISNTGRIVIVGAYYETGIAGYSGEDGQELWRRKDLKKVQSIAFSGDDSRVLCCFDRGPCESLNVATGRSGKSLRGVRAVWESPFTPVRFLQRSKDYALADFEASITSIPRVSFAVLDAAFSPTLVCVSESGGPVRAFDVTSGVQVWQYTPPAGTHFLRVAFCEVLNSFAGVSWPFKSGGPLLLQIFSPENGSPTVVADMGPATEIAFCLCGANVVTSAGGFFDVKSGKQTAKLPFPAD